VDEIGIDEAGGDPVDEDARAGPSLCHRLMSNPKAQGTLGGGIGRNRIVSGRGKRSRLIVGAKSLEQYRIRTQKGRRPSKSSVVPKKFKLTTVSPARELTPAAVISASIPLGHFDATCASAVLRPTDCERSASISVSDRPMPNTCQPRDRSNSAVARPIPALAPLMTAMRSGFILLCSCLADLDPYRNMYCTRTDGDHQPACSRFQFTCSYGKL
jgi:hypothetical protein